MITTYQQDLECYIQHMSEGGLGYQGGKDLAQGYIIEAKRLLDIAKINQENHPERYAELENQRQNIQKIFRGDEIIDEHIMDLSCEYDVINCEMEEVWELPPDDLLDSLFDM